MSSSIKLMLFCLFAFFWLNVTPANASDKTPQHTYPNTNFHFGGGYSAFGYSIHWGVNRWRENDSFHYLLHVHLSDKDAFVLSGLAELGFLYARAYYVNNIRLGYGGGISLVSFSARPGRYPGGFILFSESEKFLDFQPDDNETTITPGIPLEIHAIFPLSEYFSVGLHATANLNTVRVNAGLHATLQISFPKRKR